MHSAGLTAVLPFTLVALAVPLSVSSDTCRDAGDASLRGLKRSRDTW